MVKAKNDFGVEVYVIGQPFSLVWIENLYPKTLGELKSYSRSYWHYSQATAFYLSAQLLNRLETDNFTKQRIVEVASIPVILQNRLFEYLKHQNE